MLRLRRIRRLACRRQCRYRLERSLCLCKLCIQLVAKRFGNGGLPAMLCILATQGLGERPVALGPLLGELERVLARGQLESQPTACGLAAEPPVLRCLHLDAPSGELRLRRSSLLARLDPAPLHGLRLLRRAARGGPSF